MVTHKSGRASILLNSNILKIIMNNIKNNLVKIALVIFPIINQGNPVNVKELPKLEQISGVQKRNIIFVLSDDHRYDFFGFTGKVPWLKTPNLDKLALDGAYMSNAFVTNSLCSPNRVSIVTGQYSHVHKVVDNAASDPGDLIYFPQYLQEDGYQTSFFGKWHIINADDMPKPGFDHWESFKGQGVYFNPTLNINGEMVKYNDSTYITDLLTEHALNWLKHRDKNRPFFLYLSHKAVHANFEPASRHKGLYKSQKLPLPQTYWQTLSDEYKKLGWPDWVKQQRYSWHGVDYMYHIHPDIDEIVQRYCETLMGVDESVGTIMDYLEKEGLDKSSLVVYMGDNGFSWGEHGLIDKRHFYEESVKVPLIVHCPDIFQGKKTVKKMVQNVDIAPTVLKAAGLEKPDYMPGESFLRLLNSDTTNWRDKIFYEYYWEYDFPMTPTVFSVRTDKYKYIRYYGIWDSNELYDLENDPYEMVNLIEQPEYKEVAEGLVGELYDWLESTGGMQIPLKRTIKHPWGDYKYSMQY